MEGVGSLMYLSFGTGSNDPYEETYLSELCQAYKTIDNDLMRAVIEREIMKYLGLPEEVSE